MVFTSSCFTHLSHPYFAFSQSGHIYVSRCAVFGEALIFTSSKKNSRVPFHIMKRAMVCGRTMAVYHRCPKCLPERAHCRNSIVDR